MARLDPRGGVVRVRWDGEPGELTTGATTVDFYRPHRTLLRNFTLRPRHLTAGTHALDLVFEGAPADVKRPELGLDFIWVQKIG